jgi:hypothetical protein
MPTERAIIALLLALLGTGLAVPVHAQTQWGSSTAPAWGQLGTPTWGQYQGTIGANGWQYNKQLQANVPKGAILNPNQIGGGPGSGTLYTTPDTRLLGRTGP